MPAPLTSDAIARILSGPADIAAHWLREQSDLGVVEAQAVYAQVLLDGRGVTADPALAFEYFAKAARAGHPMACNMTGRCYENGWGRPQSDRAAADWYRRAADLGLDWGMYNLATLLTLGRGVPEDRAQALGLYRQAAALGHAKSLNIIGGFYEDGWEVEKNLDTARDYYRRASAAGDFRGDFNHGRFLAQDGEVDAARALFLRARQNAPQPFIDKMVAWLEDRAFPLEG